MKTKRILSAVFALVFVLSTLTFVGFSASAAVAEVYVDQASGNDSNAGTLEAPLKTMAAAYSKIGGEGTVYVIGQYSFGSGHFPSSSKTVTIEGVDDTSSLTNGANAQAKLNGPTVFKNITIAPGTNAFFNTCGYKTVFGEGTESNRWHIGNTDGASTASEYVVIDSGTTIGGTLTWGGAYHAGGAGGIRGDANLEVLSGTLSSLNLNQDGWQATHQKTPIGGNFNVRVGSAGKINSMSNTSRPAVINGYFQVIVEEGGSMCAVSIPNAVHQDYYWINLRDTVNGNVDFTSKGGVFNVTAKEGYIAAVTYDGKTNYYAPGEIVLPASKEIDISFDNTKVISPVSKTDITIAPATPGETEWPVSVSDEEYYTVSASRITPEDATVGYGKAYTYDIVLETVGDYVFPADFTFTINGLEKYDSETNIRGYRIENFEKDSLTATFTYTADITAGEDGKSMISYEGGIGSSVMSGKTAPENIFVAPGETINIEDNCYVQGGYRFIGYTDGNKVYQPGDEYVVGENNVVFKAVWEILEPVTVVFQPNGATGGFAPDTISAYEGMYVTIPENTFAYVGHIFEKWTDEDGIEYMPGDVIMLGNTSMTLTANWVANPNAGTSIYVDGASGSATGDGLTPETALDSIVNAYALANGADATIIIVGSAEIKGNLPATAGYTTITGYDRDSVLNIPSNVSLGGDTTIENVKINAKSDVFIATNGNKAVIGPNLENVGVNFDLVDGGNGITVDKIDTTIKSGVKIGTYYLGGAALSSDTQGINGNAEITIDGADIGTFEFSPKGSVSASVNGYILLTVNSGNIENFSASKALKVVDNNQYVTIVLFNNGMYEKIPDSVTSCLEKRNNGMLYIVDSGMGGKASLMSSRAVAVESYVDGAYYANTLTARNYVAVRNNMIAFRNYGSQGVMNIRYGSVYNARNDGAIEIGVGTPTGGAEAFSIGADCDNTNFMTEIESWTPALVGGKFGYEKQYSAVIRITPADGIFFNNRATAGVAVTVNGVNVTSEKYNDDGSVSVSCAFDEPTGYAPIVNIIYEAGDAEITGTVPVAEEWEHMSTRYLANVGTMTNLGYRFNGWRCNLDGKLYKANSAYSVTGNSDVVFTAEWQLRGSWELPNVLLLYDLTMYAGDKGRNPGWDSSDKPIRIEAAFANLENEINGTKSTKTTEFDHETVTFVTSDGSSSPMKINNWSLDKVKADPHEYKYVTIVYYYQSESAAAAGGNGNLIFGNCKLPDGSTSGWYGAGVNSTNTIVANKWASVVFDISNVASDKDIPEGSFIRQMQICPIGTKTCAELKDDTLYLKEMYFSKLPPILE